MLVYCLNWNQILESGNLVKLLQSQWMSYWSQFSKHYKEKPRDRKLIIYGQLVKQQGVKNKFNMFALKMRLKSFVLSFKS